MNRIPVAALVALAFLAASCRSYSHRAGVGLLEGQTARVEVLGDHPTVRVESGGPGWLQVELEAAAGAIHDTEVIAAGSALWSFRGPISLVVTAMAGHGDTMLRVAADGCTGLSLDASNPVVPAPE
jgi:hypothetical protein